MTSRVKTSDIPDAEILDACRAFHAGAAATPDVALAHKYPVKVIMAKMEKLYRRGLLDCGVSLRTAWVVERADA
jgi:hypothetical protein